MEKAIHIAKRRLEKRLEANSYNFNKLLKHVIKTEGIESGISLLDKTLHIERSVKSHVAHYNIVFGHFKETGGFKMAFKLFNEMKRYGTSPSDHTYSLLFEAMCIDADSFAHPGVNKKYIERLWLMARQFEAKRKHPMPTAQFNSFLKAVGRIGSIKDVLDALPLPSMPVYKTVEPSLSLPKGFVDPEYKDPNDPFDPSQGVHFDPITFQVAINSLVRLEAPLKLIEEYYIYACSSDSVDGQLVSALLRLYSNILRSSSNPSNGDKHLFLTKACSVINNFGSGSNLDLNVLLPERDVPVNSHFSDINSHSHPRFVHPNTRIMHSYFLSIAQFAGAHRLAVKYFDRYVLPHSVLHDPFSLKAIIKSHRVLGNEEHVLEIQRLVSACR